VHGAQAQHALDDGLGPERICGLLRAAAARQALESVHAIASLTAKAGTGCTGSGMSVNSADFEVERAAVGNGWPTLR
jgi:hypothetical protein